MGFKFPVLREPTHSLETPLLSAFYVPDTRLGIGNGVQSKTQALPPRNSQCNWVERRSTGSDTGMVRARADGSISCQHRQGALNSGAGSRGWGLVREGFLKEPMAELSPEEALSQAGEGTG